VAVANKDGKIYLLDAKSLGGADHKTPLAVSTAVGNVITGDLSTFEAGGSRWILAPVAGGVNSATHFAAMNGSVTNGAVAAFKVVDQSGKPSLQPAWLSRDLTNPLTSLIVNGVVFATSGGNAQHPAVLYALDGSSGKELWNSGNTITSYSRTPVSGEASQMYLSTADSTIYTFGFELVK
jgi:outer membrane protein assembly factor BamB